MDDKVIFTILNNLSYLTLMSIVNDFLLDKVNMDIISEDEQETMRRLYQQAVELLTEAH